jgi:DNA-directed RNA polymerase subunit beta'
VTGFDSHVSRKRLGSRGLRPSIVRLIDRVPEGARIQLASSEEIRDRSHGEVVKPETINYRSDQAERDGLFCERIFGPVKDLECQCGRFKRVRFEGHICERCGVEVTSSRARRERLGHIELSAPMVHTLFRTEICILLDMPPAELARLYTYAAAVVTNPGRQEAEYGQLLDADQLGSIQEQALKQGDDAFLAEKGAAGIRSLLSKLDAPSGPELERHVDGDGLDRLAEWLRERLVVAAFGQQQALRRRLEVVDLFRFGQARPESMVVDVLAVLPPDLRPLLRLDDARYATSDLNRLYCQIITRNNRLRKLGELRAPEVLSDNEMRMLQEAVDALFHNGRNDHPARRWDKAPFRSLYDRLDDRLGGEERVHRGRIVDYSGQSVCVIDPDLDLHECGLPRMMAVELFKPFIIRELHRRDVAVTLKAARGMVERHSPEVFEVLEDIVLDHPILLGGSPELRRSSIQAFAPTLVDGKAVRIPPMLADEFGGCDVVVHVPLSFEAQIEARVLMLSSNNLLRPSDGGLGVAPSHDIALGSYYLTFPGLKVAELEKTKAAPPASTSCDDKCAEAIGGDFAEAPRYSTLRDVETSIALGIVNVHTAIWYWTSCLKATGTSSWVSSLRCGTGGPARTPGFLRPRCTRPRMMWSL